MGTIDFYYVGRFPDSNYKVVTKDSEEFYAKSFKLEPVAYKDKDLADILVKLANKHNANRE